MTVKELIKDLINCADMDSEVFIDVVRQESCPCDKYTGIEELTTGSVYGSRIHVFLKPKINLIEEPL